MILFSISSSWSSNANFRFFLTSIVLLLFAFLATGGRAESLGACSIPAPQRRNLLGRIPLRIFEQLAPIASRATFRQQHRPSSLIMVVVSACTKDRRFQVSNCVHAPLAPFHCVGYVHTRRSTAPKSTHNYSMGLVTEHVLLDE